MKLIIENYPEGEKLLQHAFKHVSERLRLTDVPGNVMVRIEPLNEQCDCPRCAFSTVYGATSPTLTPQGDAMVKLDISITRKVQPLLETFCHELVHVKQMVYDGLDMDYPNRTKYFQGRGYRIDFDEDEPWEAEAYPFGEELADEVYRTLRWKRK